MNKTEVARILGFVSGSDPRQPADELAIEAWAELLADVDYEAAKRFVVEYYSDDSQRYSVRPADIIGAVGMNKKQDAIEADNRSARARGILPPNHDMTKPLPDDVQAKLDNARKVELGFVDDEVDAL